MRDKDHDDRIRRAQLARAEARMTIDEQTAKLSDINEKAMQVFRVHIVLTGILVSGISISVRLKTATASAVLNPFTELGVVLLFTSIVLSALTYTSTHGEIGVSPDDVTERILEEQFDYDLVEEGLAEAYSTWIGENYRANTRNALLFTLTLLATVMAICYLFLGAVEVYSTSLPWYANLFSLTLLAVVGKSSGLPGQLRRWQNLTNSRVRFRSWTRSLRTTISDVIGIGEP